MFKVNLVSPLSPNTNAHNRPQMIGKLWVKSSSQTYLVSKELFSHIPREAKQERREGKKLWLYLNLKGPLVFYLCCVRGLILQMKRHQSCGVESVPFWIGFTGESGGRWRRGLVKALTFKTPPRCDHTRAAPPRLGCCCGRTSRRPHFTFV